MKKNPILVFIIAGTLCAGLIGCSNTDKVDRKTSSPSDINTKLAPTALPFPMPTLTSTKPTLTNKKFIPSKENVKLLGRTYLLGDTLWMAYSATGIEFTFTGIRADITLVGDNIAIVGSAPDSFCRYGIYVNDKLVIDELLKAPKKTITVFKSDTEKTVTVRVIKLSESANSTLGIGKINVVTKGVIQPTTNKAHTIEFIGDSITCGFGVDADDENSQFTTATEDATKSYAYKTAIALDANYSMVSLSGYGIISGYTDNGEINPGQILPPYYDKLGFSYGYFNSGIQASMLSWDFTQFIPDLIVINLGTNDSSYCGNDLVKQAAYTKGYITFLKQIREKNPDATLLCTLGIMGDTLYPALEEAVTTYSAETGDTKVSSMKYDVQQASDGYGASWHPSEITHTKAADKLTAEIKNIMGW